MTIPEDWDAYDANEVWGYAAGVKPEDVAETLYSHEGENDGDSWWAVFKLKNGKYFFLTAWCDYTGWGCQEGGDSHIEDRLDKLVALRLSAEQRREAGWQLPEDQDNAR